MYLFEQTRPLDEKKLQGLLSLGYARPLASLLLLRGIETKEQAEEFLHPSLARLHSPFLMPDMQRAVERIQRAKAEGQRVVIYGDYDADGVTATALLLEALRKLGMDVGYYIPDRHEEGYGLNKAAVERLAKEYRLMVTVDCGISSVEEVALAQRLGMDVIVSDHHHLPERLPDCLLLDPKIPGYPFPHLAGVGVAFKLAQALGGMELAQAGLDLAAIGTVADIVNLLDENRAIVFEGLRRINRAPRPGIAALMEICSLGGKELTSTHIGFMLGPRINAGGRIGHSARSVEMLITQDKRLALEIASDLEGHNQLRQAQEASIMQGALEQIARDEAFNSARACVVTGEDWNPGVVGIVASRLVERFYRPAFVMAKVNDTYVCSARSIRGVKLFQLLEGMQDLFLRYGGHDLAAGLTLKAENLPAFCRRLEDALAQEDDGLWIPRVPYDLKAELSDFTVEFLKSLDCLQPFGQGNQMPVYLLEDAKVLGAATMGQNGNHLRLSLQQNGVTMDAAAFKMGNRAAEATGRIRAAVVPEINVWQGRVSVRLMVRQFAPSLEGFLAQATEGEQAWLADGLPLLFGPLQPGFKRHLRAGEERVLELIRSSLTGTLLLYSSVQTLQSWIERLREAGLLQRLRLGVGVLAKETPARNLLCALGQLEPEAYAAYQNIVLLDGAPDRAVVDGLLALAPGTLLFVVPEARNLRALVEASNPSLEQTRLLYRALRAVEPKLARTRSLEELHRLVERACPLSLPSLWLALKAMEDMELLRLQEHPFQLRMAQQVQGKRDYSQTKLVQRLDGFLYDNQQLS